MDWQNAIFAPGWVWSMLGLVLVVGTLVGLYRQLRLQSAQGAREHLDSIDREWSSERLERCKLEVLIALRDGQDPAGVPRGAALTIGSYWERIGALVASGHLDPKLLHAFIGGSCPVWWVALTPFLQKFRESTDDPTEYRHFERLSAVMADLDRRSGASLFTEALLTSQLDDRIDASEDRIRLAREMRGSG